MTTPQAQCAQVKATLTAGKAISFTVTTLQSLLSAEVNGKDTASNRTKASNDKAVSSKRSKNAAKSTANAAPRTARRAHPVPIHEDEARSLPPKDRYALATDVVNITLKVLTEALKNQPKKVSMVLSNNASPATWKRSRESSAGVLEPRSENATPARPSPLKCHNQNATPKAKAAPESALAMLATAECSRLAFSFLRSINTQKLGVRGLPVLQLENGMLTLSSKLVSHGLESLALKELRILKHRLESVGSSKKSAATEKETLASLLRLELNTTDLPQLVPLAISYQNLVLRVIASSRKSASVESCVAHLDLALPSSPFGLIIKQSETSGDLAKTGRMLESLSATLLSMCPSVNASVDSLAMKQDIHASPGTVFKLQVIALKLRQKWWALVGHQADVEKELHDPLHRCLAAFVRRSRSERTKPAYHDTEGMIQDLLTHSQDIQSKALFSIHRTLCSLAESAGEILDALKQTDCMSQQCKHLPQDHAQRLAVASRRFSLAPGDPVAKSSMADLMSRLKGSLAGSSSDYEYLLQELAVLLPRLLEEPSVYSEASDFFGTSASFTQRFLRSYPGRGISYAQTIIHCSLRHSATPDQALSWIAPEAAKAFIAGGALRSVTQAAAIQPTQRAWNANSSTLTLARILRLLVTKTIKANPSGSVVSLLDGENLSGLELGLALEQQLATIIEHTARPKYHANLKKLLPDLFSNLNQIYSQEAHPVRRANIAVKIMLLHETCPELVPPHRLSPWKSTVLHLQDLAQDEPLRPYASDVKTALDVTRLFNSGQPSLHELQLHVQTWQNLLGNAEGPNSMDKSIYDPSGLFQLLKTIGSFLSATGADSARLPVLLLLTKVNMLCKAKPESLVVGQVDLAMQWLDLGFAEKARECLLQAQPAIQSTNVDTLGKIQYHLANAACYLGTGDIESCQKELLQTQGLREALDPRAVSRSQRLTYERIHAEGWLCHSDYSLESRAPQKALASAKHAVKVLNSTWHRLENGSSPTEDVLEVDPPADETANLNQLTTGVSKLRLSPAKHTRDEKKPENKGASFWPLVSLLCRALTRLSDLYAHHGLYSEANYYSGRAIEIGESVGSSILLSRVRSYRVLLLARAGQLEDAELCLASSEDADLSAEPLAMVERLRAEAAIRVREGSSDEAFKLYEMAEGIVGGMQTEDYVAKLDYLGSGDKTSAKSQSAQDRKASGASAAEPKSKRGTKTAASRKALAVKASRERDVRRPISNESSGGSSFVLLDQIQQSLRFERLLTISKHDSSDASISIGIQNQMDQNLSHFRSFSWRHLAHDQKMSQALAAMATDITYSILPESTLSFPATIPQQSAKVVTSKSTKATQTNRKPIIRQAAVMSGFATLLEDARNTLAEDTIALTRHLNVAEAHSKGSLMTNVSMLLSASASTSLGSHTTPLNSSFTLEFPRMNALQCEQAAALVDVRHEKRSTPFEWPSPTVQPPETATVASDFQTDYIDIIPTPWAAVSLSLSANNDILYVTRYRTHQTPFILRLPFARQQNEDETDTFDYTIGKAELADIIRLSNHSCHNNGDMSSKTAKSGWWSEREALDRRLQELLINIEDIWLGGFKGILSARQRQGELLTKFRKSFESVLNRHLPSRQSTKGKPKKLALDDHVLELFVNLGSDNDGTIDLDEPISDLLYFVVDMLQFNSERNAYDEVDFDTMAVEVLDALRSYHEACDEQEASNGHVVLVLDKRLQAFPWENLPCLEGVSVSRVGSMLSLRECILAMRQEIGCPDRRHAVSRRSGSYILNPSADLASTQATLEPALMEAAAAGGGSWKSFVKQAPTEDEFKATLENSSILLYFGHGAGSQYIRPRSIKKLDSCSEVVWLMGCSSGAVIEYGELEPQAVPLAYLLAGEKHNTHDVADEPSDKTAGKTEQNSKCFSVLATLWDVTDKDIDRFSLAVGEDWGLWSFAGSESSIKLPAKTPRKREKLTAPPSTPPRAPKTPKTPRAYKTPVAAKTPKRSGSRVRNRGLSLSEAVAKSRDTCYLRYLNGAAPVVYGVPVYLGD